VNNVQRDWYFLPTAKGLQRRRVEMVEGVERVETGVGQN
jgi:hypothetical protein